MFGTLSKDAFIQRLIDIQAGEITGADALVSAGAAGHMATLIMNIQEGGYSAYKIHDMAEQSQDIEALESALLITSEPGSPVCDNRGSLEKTKTGEIQKVGSPKVPEDGNMSFSIRALLGSTDDAAGVNLPGGPTKEKPGLAVIQMFPAELNYSSRDGNAVAVFMNGIPTLEMSRCVPYLDVRLIQNFAPMDVAGSAQGISLYRFLEGRSAPAGADLAFLGGLQTGEARLMLLNDQIDELTDDASAADADQLTAMTEEAAALHASILGAKANPATSSGMEIFTSPQTLVPGDENYDDFQAYHDLGTGFPKRGAPLIDKFRPFMSIDSFSLKVLPTRGTMSYKSGQLIITLHDRSRLSEIASLVKPGAENTNELMITYGWSHPDSGGLNAYGEFLDSLKVTEKYSVYQSSYNFDTAGQVKITLKLSMKAAKMVDITTISGSTELSDKAKVVRDLFRLVNRLKKEKLGDYGVEDIDEDSIVDTPDELSDATSISTTEVASIVAYLGKDDGDDDDLAAALEKLYGADGKSGAAASLGKGITAALSTKKQLLKVRYDPFFRQNDPANADLPDQNDMTVNVSLGKIMALFFGEPLAATGLYDEVQLIFYCFNAQSGFMRNHNISQMPININTFTSQLDDDFAGRGKVSLRDFWRFVCSRFCNNMASKAYGFNTHLERDAESGAAKAKSEKAGNNLNTFVRAQMDIAYDAESSKCDKTFKKPRIDMTIEVVPYAPDGNPALVDPSRGTLCRVHIYDKQATTYSGMGKLLRSAKDLMNTAVPADIDISPNQTGLQSHFPDGKPRHANHSAQFTKLFDEKDGVLKTMLEPVQGATPTSPSYQRFIGGFEGIKHFIKQQMPSIIYGSSASAILSAKLASQGNSKLATIQMMRSMEGGDDGPPGTSSAVGLPLRINPMQLSMDIIGCPLVNYMQQFFIDFGTGTTADNMYVVTGLTHKIQAGKFISSVKLTYVDAFGTYETMVDGVEKAMAALKANA
jgi:hypothetical protein